MGAISQKSAEFLIRSRLADAEKGNVDALFELGVTYSTGRGGAPVDLIEAHKWFNLAALSGCTRGQQCRAGIEHAGARHHAEDARFAGRARIAEGHIAAGLLVARADHLQLRLVEGVEQAVDLRAGQAEHGVDAMRDKAIDVRFAAGS